MTVVIIIIIAVVIIIIIIIINDVTIVSNYSVTFVILLNVSPGSG